MTGFSFGTTYCNSHVKVNADCWMRRVMQNLAVGFAMLSCEPSAVLANGATGSLEKDRPLLLNSYSETMQSRLGAKAKIVGYEVPRISLPALPPVRPSTAQDGIQVSRADRGTMQLRDKNELHYRYASGSSLTVSARPHRLSFGWRTRF